MKFTLGLVALSLFAAANALPSHEREHDRSPSHDKGHDRFPVPSSMTVKEGSTKCGDQAQLSCCNKAKYGGDSTVVSKGIASGLLSNLLGAGSAAEGLGAFTGCSKLDLPIFGIQDILNQQCKQSIACCAGSGSSADKDVVGVALPCLALGALL
ncbi:hypothetical protein BDW59DRAFT_163582 [Aspergillus cavernicola]|uniref:Hydrophobin n=1 Tax=Aspergillus cavernicola TaxID=176166 RepID=A0ABR4I4T7_9EURO